MEYIWLFVYNVKWWNCMCKYGCRNCKYDYISYIFKIRDIILLQMCDLAKGDNFVSDVWSCRSRRNELFGSPETVTKITESLWRGPDNDRVMIGRDPWQTTKACDFIDKMAYPSNCCLWQLCLFYWEFLLVCCWNCPTNDLILCCFF